MTIYVGRDASERPPIDRSPRAAGPRANGPGAVWTDTCAALRSELGESTFGSWIAQAQLREGADGGLVVVTPTGIARDWIRRNAWRRIGELWTQNDPDRRSLHLNSRAEFEAEHGVAGDAVVAASTAPAAKEAPVVVEFPATAAPARLPGLQERFTFDSFVPGPANEFALAVARRVASWALERPTCSTPSPGRPGELGPTRRSSI
jgi:chromosomal replication initiator protein